MIQTPEFAPTFQKTSGEELQVVVLVLLIASISKANQSLKI